MAADPTARRQQRVSVSLKVNLKFPDRQTFELRFAQNISRSGIFIRAKDPVPVGSRVRFEYLLADQSRVMRGVGVVRWVRTAAEAKEPEAPPGMGIEFVDIDPQTDELITQIVAKHGDGPRAPKKPKGLTAAQRGADASPAPVRTEVLEPEEEDVLSALSEGGSKRAAAADAAAAAAASESIEPTAQLAEAAAPDAPAPRGSEVPQEEASAAAARAEPAVEEGSAGDSDSSAASGAPTETAGAPPDGDLGFESAAAAPPEEPREDLDSDVDQAFAGALESDVAAESARAPDSGSTPAPASDAPESEASGEAESPQGEPAAALAASPSAAAEASAPEPTEAPRAAAAPLQSAEAPAPQPAETKPSAEPSEGAAVAAAVSTQPLLIDLCSADILAASRDDGALRGQSSTTPRFTFNDSGIEVDPNGVLLPHLLSWLSPGWPTPRDRARARRLGFEVRTGSVRPAVRVGERVYEVAAALDSALRHTLAAHGKPRVVSVVVPSTASRQARAAVRESLKKLGVEQIILMDDAVAALHGAGVELGAGAHVLIVQPSLYETRLALVEAPDTLIAASGAPDPCLADADAAVTRLAELELLRQHRLDVGADAALRRELAARAGSIRRQGGEWRFELAGAAVELPAAAVVAELAPLAERLVAQCAALLDVRQLSGKDLRAVIVAADEPLWPGLAATIEEQLGIELSFANAGAWTRLSSVAASTELGN